MNLMDQNEFLALSADRLVAEPSRLASAASATRLALADRLAARASALCDVSAALARYRHAAMQCSTALPTASSPTKAANESETPIAPHMIAALWLNAAPIATLLDAPRLLAVAPTHTASVALYECVAELAAVPRLAGCSILLALAKQTRVAAANTLHPALTKALTDPNTGGNPSRLLLNIALLRRLRFDDERTLARLFLAPRSIHMPHTSSIDTAAHEAMSENYTAAIDAVRRSLVETAAYYRTLFRTPQTARDLLCGAVAGKIDAALQNQACLRLMLDPDYHAVLADLDAALAEFGLCFAPLVVAAYDNHRLCNDFLPRLARSSDSIAAMSPDALLRLLRRECAPRIPVFTLHKIAAALAPMVTADPDAYTLVCVLWNSLLERLRAFTAANGGFLNEHRLAIVNKPAP